MVEARVLRREPGAKRDCVYCREVEKCIIFDAVMAVANIEDVSIRAVAVDQYVIARTGVKCIVGAEAEDQVIAGRELGQQRFVA